MTATFKQRTVTVDQLNGQAFPSGNARVTAYTYDAVGNLDRVSENNGTPNLASDDLSHDYEYESLNRLTELDVKKGSASIFSQHYVLESDGQRDSVTEKRNGVHVRHRRRPAPRLPAEAHPCPQPHALPLG